MVTRKNLRHLSPEEVETLRNAFAAMYDDDQQRYQSFSTIMLNYGHATRNDLDFLTWNRAFFHALEQLLQEYAPGFGLPYWDYTEEESINFGLPGFISEPEYYPEDRQEAVPNPLYRGVSAIKMVTYRETKKDLPSPILKRALDCADKALEEKTYQNFLFQIYQADVASHIWIGGSMTNLNAAMLDPLFWFSHCNLDRYWHIWQQKQSNLGADTMPPSVLSAKLKPFLNVENSDTESPKPYPKAATAYLSGEAVLNIGNLSYCYEA